MTVQLVCPRCSQKIEVQQGNNRRSIQCPSCQATLTLKSKAATPKAEPDSIPPKAADVNDLPRRRRYDEDAEDAPRKRRLDEDEDDRDRPRRRSERDGKDIRRKRWRDEEDDRAGLRSSRRRDDDDDDRPRRRWEDSTDDDRPRRRRRKMPNSRLVLILLFVGGGVLLASLIGVIIVAIGVSYTRTFQLQQGQMMFWNITFKQNHKVEIWVRSDGQSDVDLYVFDAQGKTVAFDDGDSKDCYVMFVARQTQSYKVEVRNMQRIDQPWRNGSNSGIMEYAETFLPNPPPEVDLPPAKNLPPVNHPPGVKKGPPAGNNARPRPPVELDTNPEPNEGPPPAEWTVLFRSDDPALWNTNSPGPGPDFALPVRKAHSKIRYLRLKRMDSTEAVIVPITHQQLARQPSPVPKIGYGWNGTASEQYGGRHLGIYQTPFRHPFPRGEIAVMVDGINPCYFGSGFGHKGWADDGQYWAWQGKEIPRTVFEIAVTVAELTVEEKRKLLPGPPK